MNQKLARGNCSDTQSYVNCNKKSIHCMQCITLNLYKTNAIGQFRDFDRYFSWSFNVGVNKRYEAREKLRGVALILKRKQKVRAQ